MALFCFLLSLLMYPHEVPWWCVFLNLCDDLHHAELRVVKNLNFYPYILEGLVTPSQKTGTLWTTEQEDAIVVYNFRVAYIFASLCFYWYFYSSLSLFYFIFCMVKYLITSFNFFIVIHLQLSAFSPHPSTPPQPVPPPSFASTLPLDLVHVSFIVVPVIPSPHCPLPTPLWLLLDCS